MFGKLFASLKAGNNNDEASVRRKFTRRDCDHCITEINGKIYPVENWSFGGVLLNADDREFAANDDVNLTLKFKLRDRILDIPHEARIIRKSKNKVAIEFKPLTHDKRGHFQNVVDDHMATEFAASQSQF